MAWNLGLVRGAASGADRQRKMKYADRMNMARTQASEFEQLIGQLRLNKEEAYRKERDNIGDIRWKTKFDRDVKESDRNYKLALDANQRAENADQRAGVRQSYFVDEAKNRIRRRPIVEAQDDKRFNLWVKKVKDEAEMHDETIKGIRKQYEYDWGDGETKGVRALQREKLQLGLDALKLDSELNPLRRDATELTLKQQIDNLERIMSPEEQKRAKLLRESEVDMKDAQIGLIRAQTDALNKPKSTGTGSTLKLPTVSQLVSSWKNPGLAQAITGKDGRKLEFTSLNEESQMNLVSQAGRIAGRMLFGQIGNIPHTRNHVNQYIDAMFQSELDHVIGEGDKAYSVSSVVLDKVPPNEKIRRMSKMREAYRAAALEGYNYGGAGGGGNIMDILKNTPMTESGGPIVGPSRYPTLDLYRKDDPDAYPQTLPDDYVVTNPINNYWAKLGLNTIGKYKPDVDIEYEFELLNMWMNREIQNYSRTGKMDQQAWKNFGRLNEKNKETFFNQFGSPDVQNRFQTDWSKQKPVIDVMLEIDRGLKHIGR